MTIMGPKARGFKNVRRAFTENLDALGYEHTVLILKDINWGSMSVVFL
jgi:hypothetical protein